MADVDPSVEAWRAYCQSMAEAQLVPFDQLSSLSSIN